MQSLWLIVASLISLLLVSASYHARDLLKPELIQALPQFLKKYGAQNDFQLEVFLRTLDSTFDVESGLIHRSEEIRNALLENGVQQLPRFQQFPSSEQFKQDYRKRPFPYTLDGLVADLRTLVAKYGCDTYVSSDEFVLDAVIVILSSGLSIFTKDMSDAIKEHQDVENFYFSLYYALIENYLGALRFESRRFPDLSFLIESSAEIAFMRLFTDLSFPLNCGTIVEFRSSIFRFVWSEEEYFNFIKKSYLIEKIMSSHLVEQFDWYQKFWNFMNDEILVVRNITCTGDIQRPIKVLQEIQLQNENLNLSNCVDISSATRVFVVPSNEQIFPAASEWNNQEPFIDFLERINENADLVVKFTHPSVRMHGMLSLIHEKQMMHRTSRKLHLVLKRADYANVLAQIPDSLQIKSVSTDATPDTIACLTKFTSIKDLFFFGSIQISNDGPLLLNQLSAFPRLRKLSIIINLSVDSFNLANTIGSLVDCPSLMHVKISVTGRTNSKIIVDAIDSRLNFFLEFAGGNVQFDNLMQDLNSIDNSLVICTNFQRHEMESKYPNVAFIYGPPEQERRFTKTKPAPRDF